MKAVNSEAKPVLGVAKAVELKLGGWSGTVNLSAVPMDDFRVILGMDFLRAAKVVPMPYLGVVSIMDTKTPSLATAEKLVEFTKKAEGSTKGKTSKPNQGKGGGDEQKGPKQGEKKGNFDDKSGGKPF
ncbi:hypothetical protein AMTR_s00011p00232490 [Amborella trichopoda]|uniref:Aspartic peptidase DDI1-type domain-containing protein n=1 Tax=Amborella trichopoda TaxID=13333 RepID=W1NGW8_AMBTC|nr:hypothetical protein AMTR_s00011p00232490 [Amborella trichopoda]